ncbi:MAG TPA: DEAD/DEAH box helicase [Candidatus Marinimicrobia bacterium]|jgi:SNF2 family DNA or RNA helicase|nr:DEAD/DEAH box helicase [Candidatus Neomarinimicrobiota bacterium]
MKKRYNFNYSPKTKPFPHQVEAIEYITSKISVPLFDEQGLGKTKIVIEALCNNMEQGIIDGALIICKKHLIENWKDEIETHSHLKYIVLRGNANEKGLKFMGYSHFYIINYESVIGEVERLKMFLKIRKMAIVLDESHKIKNPNAKITRATLDLKDLATKRIIITGTPIANKPLDLWTQFYFLDNGNLLGDDYKKFEKTYSINLKGDNLPEQEARFNNLREIILSNSIRRLKKDVLELPEKIYIDKYVQIEGQQKKIYAQLKKELYIEITNIEGEKIIDESNVLLKKLLRLAQIASNPFLIDKAYNETPAKFPLLDTLIESILEQKEKVIVWSCFVDNIRILYKRYKKFGSLILYGDLPIEKRNEIVKQFRNNNEFMILIANPSAAREGLTLTSANNAIYLDRNFNLVDYLQSQDRIHRISQTKECKIYKLIAKSTIDEYIDEIIYKKHKLAEYVQGDIENIEKQEYLTKEEILNILGEQ